MISITFIFFPDIATNPKQSHYAVINLAIHFSNLSSFFEKLDPIGEV